MTALIRAELIGLRTLRTTWIVPVTVVGLAALISAASMGDAGTKGMTTPAELREPVLAGAGVIAAVVLSVFAAMRVAGQYRHKTITLRVLASPRRGRILTSELLTYMPLALLVGAVALTAGFALAAPQVADKNLTLGLTAGLLVTALLAVGLFTAIGVAVGVICRSQPAAMAVIGGTFVAEKIIAGVIPDVQPYLPFEFLNATLGLGNSPVSRGAGVLALAGIAALLSAAAYVLLDRRDVT
jgi:ABC-2 type transport system permease protein